MPTLETIQEVTETVAKNLTESEKQVIIEKLKAREKEIVEGLANPDSIIHEMVFESEKKFFQSWANILKQQHFLGIYTKPINTISTHIKHQIGKMQTLSVDKKENLYRNIERSLSSEFKEERADRQNVGENTSAFSSIEDSIVYYVIAVAEEYHEIMIQLLRKFRKHLENPQIRADFEKLVEWEEIALQCATLKQLQTPIKEFFQNFAKLDKQLADHTTLKHIEENINIRQSVDAFRNCMRLLVHLLPSYRNWAHKFGISPRQHQRVRERDPDWPEKPAEMVIKQVLGSTLCPGCKIDLITKRKYYDTPPDKLFIQYSFKEKKYKIPDEYKNKGLNPCEIADKVWGKELRLVAV